MSTAQDNRNGTGIFAHLAATILFVLVAGMGYAISPRVVGAVDLPVSAEDQAEPPYLASECVSHGLVLSECNLDF